jgi:hypothetical protein
MRTKKPHKALAGIATASLLVAGCGETLITVRSPIARPAKVFIAWDGSGFGQYAKNYQEEIVTAVQEFAAHRDEVFGAILDGQPLTTAQLKRRDFSVPVDAEEGLLAERQLIDAIASGFVAKLLKREPERVQGSGQLQGLQVAAGIAGVNTILMWTDAIVNEPLRHFNLTSASDEEIRSEIGYWHPRLKALRGKRVVLIGVGRGIESVATVERAKRMFETLVEGDGGELEWLTVLNAAATQA